ncbi:type I restriction enzyme HsdR N-terminal domain-containing protein [Rhizobium sp. NZLR1]|uniref:type I restriction enzyme HsdR N-terminal domain-containing protein n=1 Tax=Rhizobium sp. NZLR1 TaxID=2731096 RepID=UPI001A986352|nr:type I restriction enzyme HsdR N-terminal domain-containing protein [Rhizobium sp. NZLR1]MBX5204328.1 type I restriction endonuclease subunit R [Rhizobium sp. NZLR1]QSZ22041.1 type I restriction enzyme HsdR N-terminal domain-containing protein [Rhizobium sp. NZLR1]
MSIFAPHNIDHMNEDDVSGELIRPLCRALGYTQGNPEANLRSQVSLQYDKAFLGHKKGEKDPVLRGKPDFVCEVVSYARWVVEAKKPSIQLSQDDSYQAHTYATHPEIAAEFYLLSNGREFKVYRVGNPDAPIFAWLKDETDEKLPTVRNLLGPDAMRKRADVKIDIGKPLSEGLGSEARILNGHVVYERNTCSLPVDLRMDGIRNGITGSRVFRTDDGLISAVVEIVSAFAGLDELNKRFGFSPFLFKTADEYISVNRESPTLMQNLVAIDIPAGTQIPATLLSPAGVLPFALVGECYTEATGFVEDKQFKGTFVIDYLYKMVGAKMLGLPAEEVRIRSEGPFEVTFE